MENRELILKKLGERIRIVRMERGLSQAMLGARIFKDQQSIHKVEIGKFNPTYIYLLELSQGLEISLDELIKDL